MRAMVLAVALLSSVSMTAACGGDDEDDGPRAGTGGGMAMAGRGGGQAGENGGGFDAGSDPMRNDVMPGGICQRLAEITCAGEQACCDAPGRTAQACISAVSGACSSMLMADTLAAEPAVAFNAAAAKTAFTEFENRASTCDPEIAAWAVSANGFPTSFAGTLASGADCEPEGGLQADIDDLLVALASCQTAGGQACLPGEGGWTCAPRSAAGGRCYNDFNCADGLFCENPDGEFDGTCMAAKSAGADCRGPLECESLICNDRKCAPSGDVQAAYCSG